MRAAAEILMAGVAIASVTLVLWCLSIEAVTFVRNRKGGK